MLIMVAGPYTHGAVTEDDMQKNLDILNEAAYEVYLKGHIPVVGVNNGMPVLERYGEIELEKFQKIMMDICLELAERCDAILMLKESPGANMERDIFIKNDKKIFNSLEEIPE